MFSYTIVYAAISINFLSLSVNCGPKRELPDFTTLVLSLRIILVLFLIVTQNYEKKKKKINTIKKQAPNLETSHQRHTPYVALTHITTTLQTNKEGLDCIQYITHDTPVYYNYTIILASKNKEEGDIPKPNQNKKRKTTFICNKGPG